MPKFKKWQECENANDRTGKSIPISKSSGTGLRHKTPKGHSPIVVSVTVFCLPDYETWALALAIIWQYEQTFADVGCPQVVQGWRRCRSCSAIFSAVSCCLA